MRRFLTLLCIIFATSCMTCPAQATAQPENEVKRVITGFADAWNRHDVPAMLALHTADVNFTNISGQWWKGKDQVRAGLQQVHATVFARSTMTIRTEQVRFLTDSVAVVHGLMELHDVPPAAQGECTFIRVLVRRNGRWLIDDFQNTTIHLPDTPPPAS